MQSLVTINPDLLKLSTEQLAVLHPLFWLFGGAVIAMILATIKFGNPKWLVFLTTFVAMVAGGWASIHLIGQSPVMLFNGMMVSDSYSNFFNVVFAATAGLTAFVSIRYLDREDLQHPEYYILLLFSTIGMMLMASVLDLIVVFIALELMSLPVYVLAGFRRADRRSNEASIKYFILGSVASAILLYGVALLYGVTHSTNLKTILAFAQSPAATGAPLFLLGAFLVLIGFMFKVASVPFHMWMPDVYEGAPLPVTGFMATGVKVAAFAALLRFFVSIGNTPTHEVLWWAAVLTMLIGNLIALTQTNLKRMLAYSSIAHTGYLLVGILSAASGAGYAPILVYLVVYVVMNLGAFAILGIVSSAGDQGLTLDDFSGLSERHPWLAFAMAVFMFSLAGIPPTGGFMAKYLVFASAVQAGEYWLAIIGVLCSAISVYYYLRVAVHMYMRKPQALVPASRVSLWSMAVVATMVLLILQIGVLPAQILEIVRRAVTTL